MARAWGRRAVRPSPRCHQLCSTGIPGVGVLGGRSMILTGGSPRYGTGSGRGSGIGSGCGSGSGQGCGSVECANICSSLLVAFDENPRGRELRSPSSAIIRRGGGRSPGFDGRVRRRLSGWNGLCIRLSQCDLRPGSRRERAQFRIVVSDEALLWQVEGLCKALPWPTGRPTALTIWRVRVADSRAQGHTYTRDIRSPLTLVSGGSVGLTFDPLRHIGHAGVATRGPRRLRAGWVT